MLGLRSRKSGLAIAAASLVVAVAMAGSAPAVAQDGDLTVVPAVPKDFVPAKTPWGEPDLRGGWPIDHLNGRTPLERDPTYGNRAFLNEEEYAAKVSQVEALEQRFENEDSEGKMGIGHWAEMGGPSRRTSFIIAPANGRLPERTTTGQKLTSEMRSTWRRGQPFDSPADFDSWDRCITRGLPASMFPFMYNNGIRIFQSPGLVAMQLEMVHETRLIYTDGRDPIPSPIANWMGDSRGSWDGPNTLVIETTNFQPGPSATNIGTTGSPPFNDTPVSNRAKMTERLTMTGQDEIIYEVTWNDPEIFTAPWTARLEWKRDDSYDMFEYACHEGNVQVRNYITASRVERGLQEAQTGE